MLLTRYLAALVGIVAISGSAALAAPPGGVGVGAGEHRGVGIGAPPMGVPPAHVPPISIPPVSVPKPQNAPPANANGHASASTRASLATGDVLHGTVTAVNGTTVSVRMSNGTTQTFTVTSQMAARLQSFLQRRIAFHVQNGTLALIGAGTPPLHGMLIAVNGTTAQIKLANGTTQTFTVNAQQAAWLQMHVGKAVSFWSGTNDTIELNQSSHRSATGQQHAHAKAQHPKPHSRP